MKRLSSKAKKNSIETSTSCKCFWNNWSCCWDVLAKGVAKFQCHAIVLPVLYLFWTSSEVCFQQNRVNPPLSKNGTATGSPGYSRLQPSRAPPSPSWCWKFSIVQRLDELGNVAHFQAHRNDVTWCNQLGNSQTSATIGTSTFRVLSCSGTFERNERKDHQQSFMVSSFSGLIRNTNFGVNGAAPSSLPCAFGDMPAHAHESRNQLIDVQKSTRIRIQNVEQLCSCKSINSSVGQEQLKKSLQECC